MDNKAYFIGGLLILSIWLLMYSFINQPLLPNPIAVISAMANLILNGELLIHGMFSFFRLIVALFFSVLFGTALGLYMGVEEWTTKLLVPFMYGIFPVPKVALLPVFFILLGIGELSKIVLIWSVLFFQIVITVYDAVDALDEELFISARILKLSKSQTYRLVVLPAVLPTVFSTLKTCMGIGLAVLFFVETYATNRGIGYFIMQHWSILSYERMYAGILFLGWISFTLFRGIDLWKEKVVKWK